MKIPYSEPVPAGSRRARDAKKIRDLATEVSRLQPQALTKANGEEDDHVPFDIEVKKGKGENKCVTIDRSYPANFTKGLAHDKNGIVKNPQDYHCFVQAINSTDSSLFDKEVPSSVEQGIEFHCKPKSSKANHYDDTFCAPKKAASLKWRGWESPRAGHVYELQGPDAGAVGMAPAPRVGSDELAAEMAEVYGLALLRDVPFTKIANGEGEKLCEEGGDAELTAKQILDELNGMRFFSLDEVCSSTPCQVNKYRLNSFEHNRRAARTNGDATQLLTLDTLFRGSTEGAVVGPYISQFMLLGSCSLNKTPGSSGTLASNYDSQKGLINFGNQVIDQRQSVHKSCLDYMTDWASWLDVQNGASFKGFDLFEDKRRFITTPRDLATYVHFDALYQAYLNACLLMLSANVPTSKGFPEKSVNGKRDAFATFGGPHVLSLVTEVATRCLKAVRRQKFNHHRRARPEVMGGRLTLVDLNAGVGDQCQLGSAAPAFSKMHKEIPEKIRKAVIRHNKDQNKMTMRTFGCKENVVPVYFDDHCENTKPYDEKLFPDHNLLLPMAFPEGSPMHPAYGAGHATVAGGCVTMLKAFFEMFDRKDGQEIKRVLKLGDSDYYVPNANGTSLLGKDDCELTVQGELDKLAANISIGRNMAGVHYYSDYYDSLRMGERVAIGIMLEQAPTYGEVMEVTFDSFDGDRICIQGEAGSCPSLSVIDKKGKPVLPQDWWLRHVPGQELNEDL